MDAQIQQDLADTFAKLSGARSARVRQCTLMTGGAIQQNWLFDLEFDGGNYDGPLDAVLRTNSDAVLNESLSREEEFRLFEIVFAAGVRVPEPLFYLDQSNHTGRPLFLMRRMAGQAAGHKLVKAFDSGCDSLCRDLGQQLALIQTISPPNAALDFLGTPPTNTVAHWVAQMRRSLDDLSIARPVIEWGLRYLELNAPRSGPVVLCHNDYRTGNYIVEGQTLTGVLDWEFAGWGDPMQDIGWFTAPCWRFGAQGRPAGGIGSLQAFLEGYRENCSHTPRLDELVFWQTLATLRWAVIALGQGERHRSGVEPSLELALTHHIIPELEHDILNLIEQDAHDHAA